MDLLIFKGRWGGKKREREREESGTNNKPLQNKPSEFHKPHLVCEWSPQYFLEKTHTKKKHEKCLFTLQCPEGPLQRRPGGREEGEQMWRFRWCRDMAGKWATFVWSNPSIAHTHTHTRGGILALAGPRGRDIRPWPERKRAPAFTEA